MDDLPAADLHTLHRAARALAGQTGSGVARAALVALAGGTSRPVTVFAPEPGGPVLAVVAAPVPGAGSAFAALTPRERHVSALVSDGLSNQEIADRLVLTIGTVKDHVHRILTKTGLRSRAAVAAAWRSGQSR